MLFLYRIKELYSLFLPLFKFIVNKVLVNDKIVLVLHTKLPYLCPQSLIT